MMKTTKEIELELDYVQSLIDFVKGLLEDDNLPMAYKHVFMASEVGLLQQKVRLQGDYNKALVEEIKGGV